MMPLDQIEAVLSGPALLGVLLVIGLGIGILTGLFGVGGAFLLNPILIVVMGVSEPLVIGSSLSFTIGTGATGMARHMRSGNVDILSMVIIGIGAAVGAVFGADLLQMFESKLEPRAFKVLIRAMYLVLLLLVAWLMFRNPKEREGGRSPLQRLPLAPHVDLARAGLRRVSLPGLVLVGLVIGLTKGLLGIGGGVLFMPLLLLVGMTAHQAVGTSLGVVLFSSIAGTIKHGLYGNVSLWIVMSLLVGSSVGVQIGAAICDTLHAAKLRKYFAGIAFLAAVMVAADLVNKLIKY